MYTSGSTTWKNWLAPTAVALVVIWGLYLGVTFVFHDAEEPENEYRSSERRSLVGQGNSLSPGEIASLEKEPIEKFQANAEGESNESVSSDRVKRYRSARAVLAAVSKKPVKKGTAYTQSSAIVTEDSQKRLKEQIMNEAYKTALHSEKPWQNLILISSEYYRRSDLSSARATMFAASKLAIDPDDVLETSVAMKAVVKAMLVQKNYKDAMAALQNISDAGEREKAMAEIGAWAARGGQIDVAKNILAQVSKASSRDTVLVAMAESQASYEGVVVAFRTAERIGNLRKRDDAYRRIALKRAKLKDFVTAQQTIELISNDKLRDSAWRVVARQYAKNGSVKEGLQVLNKVSDPSAVDASLRVLSNDLAKSGWFRSSAYVTTRIIGDNEKSYALEGLSRELAKSGDLSLSLIHTDAIPVKRVRERTLRYVSTVTADQGAPGRARNMAFKIRSDSERDQAYRDISKASAQNGDHVSAFNTLQEIDYPKDKALAMVSLARSLYKDGRRGKAFSLLEGAGRESQELPEKNLNQVRGDLAVAYAESAESEHSLQLAGEISDLKLRDRAYQKLARTLALKQDVESSQRSLLAISSDQLRLSAEDAVARTLAKSVVPQKAVKSSRSLLTGRQRVVFLVEIFKRI